MKIKKRYQKWIDKNVFLKKGVTIAVTGSTSGIGKALSFYLSRFDVNLILIGRNKERLNNLIKEIDVFNAKIETHVCDYSNKESVKSFLEFIKTRKIDIFYNNAGIYHQPLELIDGLDQTFLIDFLIPSMFAKELFKANPNCKVINTSSISYRYKKFDKNDIQGLKIKDKTKRYGFIKRLLMMEATYLFSLGNKDLLAHPGISYTGLFDKRNKAYKKGFYVFVSPLMKLMFMSPEKASLSLLYAASENVEIPIYHHIGPKGLFHSWGYPSVQKIKNLASSGDLKFLDEEVDKYIKEYIK